MKEGRRGIERQKDEQMGEEKKIVKVLFSKH